MQAFKDAGKYEQDEFIDFEPEGHVYTYKGVQQLLPVSSLIGYFFEPFDAQGTARSSPYVPSAMRARRRR